MFRELSITTVCFESVLLSDKSDKYNILSLGLARKVMIKPLSVPPDQLALCSENTWDSEVSYDALNKQYEHVSDRWKWKTTKNVTITGFPKVHIRLAQFLPISRICTRSFHDKSKY